ncbi:helix-turn-helix transcriptional regulator [Peptoniphilus harei]|jgi:hypothetical protein|uniref:helix-turn-helix transcriptional regulator n=1 Tax=Peptoniphilus harei TaxID=54005 RepID=UPI00254B791D|nr:helix-turn-helix transcriptional regulator [Peptoniphilus harei]MDK7377540.1 helix-turn-helix transcriptional regulator [Peptoniphilus harei]MDK7679852.1 helix-turn-helix transcriptional regulator [Peptoniphilus harei]
MNNIKKYRNDKNITQKELANKLGITQQMMSNYEKGYSTPNINLAKKIAIELESDVENIFFDAKSK